MSNLDHISTEEALKDRQETIDEITMCNIAIRLGYKRIDDYSFRDMRSQCRDLLDKINTLLAERGVSVDSLDLLDVAAKTPQQQVAEAVAQRGYRDGWTTEQFVVRNVCKLAEEVAEASEVVEHNARSLGMAIWEDSLLSAGREARDAFDEQHTWDDAAVNDIDALKAEFADIQVVLFNAAEALAELTGEPFDVVAAAVKKATTDISRGVRHSRMPVGRILQGVRDE